MIKLHEYSSGKILANQEEFKLEIDFRKEALLHPVKAKWEWMFKGGPGNLMNTTRGRVIARNGNDEPVRIIKFDGKIKRNEAVARLIDFCRPKNRHYVCVEFD